LFDYYSFNSKLWNFLELNKIKVLDFFSKSNVTLNFNNKIYKTDYGIGTDIIDLIDIVVKEKDIYHSLNVFFSKIGEKNFVNFISLKAYNEVIGKSAYLLSYILPEIGFDSNSNEFIMPDLDELYSKFSEDIIKNYAFLFGNARIYSGHKVFLHIDPSKIVSGATFDSNFGFVSSIPSYTNKMLPLKLDKFAEFLLNGQQIELLVDKNLDNSITIFSQDNPEIYNFENLITKVNINETKHSKINYVFKTELPYFSELTINKKPVYDYLIDYLKTYKGWNDKILEIESLISNMSAEDFQMFAVKAQSQLPKKLISRIKQIRALKTVDLFQFLNLELKAVKHNNFLTANELIYKHNDFYESVSLTEAGRNNFISKQELQEQVKKIKNVFEKLNGISEKEILNMVFNKIKISSQNLPVLSDIRYDGIFKIGEKYAVVSKNEFYNIDLLLEQGIFPVGKFCSLKGKEYKTLSTLINKVPEEISDYYISIIKALFSSNKKIIINVDSQKSANKLIEHLTNASGFIKYVSFSKLRDMSKKINNSNIILATITKDYEYELLDISKPLEFLGTKKELGIDYEIKHFESYIFVNILEDSGLDLENLDTNSSGIIDSIIRYVVVGQKPNLRLKYVLDRIDELAFK